MSIQRRTREELLLFHVAFAGLGERTIHPACQHTSPQLPCARPRAEIRSVLTYSSERSRARSHVIPQEQINARDDHEVKRQTDWRHRIDEFYESLRGARDSRDPGGAQDASIDVGLTCARL